MTKFQNLYIYLNIYICKYVHVSLYIHKNLSTWIVTCTLCWHHDIYTYKVFWSLLSFDTPLSCLSDHHGWWHL